MHTAPHSLDIKNRKKAKLHIKPSTTRITTREKDKILEGEPQLQLNIFVIREEGSYSHMGETQSSNSNSSYLGPVVLLHGGGSTARRRVEVLGHGRGSTGRCRAISSALPG
jgi:hypothetical protein